MLATGSGTSRPLRRASTAPTGSSTHSTSVLEPTKYLREQSQNESWRKLNLLSLDGGGVRGYWSLRALEQLMKYIGDEEDKYANKNSGNHDKSLAASKPLNEQDENNDEDGNNGEDSPPNNNKGDDTVSNGKGKEQVVYSHPPLIRKCVHCENITQLSQELPLPQREPNFALEGQHSFWPEDWPENVSQINPSKKQTEDIGTIKEIGGDDCERRMFRVTPASQRYLPCHYFDYICGTSTGALIAIMLGRFRMTVADCLREYEDLTKKIFGAPRLLNLTRGIGRTKYSDRVAEKVFRAVVDRRSEVRGDHAGPITMPSGAGMCKVFVTTMRTHGMVKSSHFFRTYRFVRKSGIAAHLDQQSLLSTSGRQRNYGEPDIVEIWQVARGVTAAPSFFKPMVIEVHSPQTNPADRWAEFEDGATDIPNPTWEGILEIRDLHGDDSIGTVLSIGTSRDSAKPPPRNPLTILSLIKTIADTVTDPEPHHSQVEKESQKTDGTGFDYYRVNNSDKPLRGISMDDCRPRKSGEITFDVITSNFNEYITNTAVQKALKACARSLVKKRRQRTEDRGRWERFAMGSRFYCSERNCETDFLNRDDFMRHLCQHDHPEGTIEKILSISSEKTLTGQGRMKKWEYQAGTEQPS